MQVCRCYFKIFFWGGGDILCGPSVRHKWLKCSIIKTTRCNTELGDCSETLACVEFFT